jgi:hypothetical protein
MYNPFGMGSARQGFGQQGSNQPYDFKGLESRLGKIETGIAGLTEQFGKFQMPGQNTVDPVYTGNTAPDPLTTAAPTGGIQSLPTPQNAGFNFDPEGGSLFSQLSTAYGQPSTMQAQFNQENPNAVSQSGGPMYLRGGGNYTQGFQDFVHDQGYYVDPRQSWVDGPMNISETPIDLPGKMKGTMQQPNQPFQTFASPSGGKGAEPFQYQGRPNDMQQPMQQGAGLASLQKGYMT